MSRKDFIAIAQTIRDLPLGYVRPANDVGPTYKELQRQSIAEQFADMLESTNRMFNRELFIQAATGVVPVTARKAVGG